MKTLRTFFFAFVGVVYILNANAQTSYVTLVATNGQQVSYSVPADTLASVVHISSPTTPSDLSSLGAGPGYLFYSVNITIRGTTAYYSSFDVDNLNFSFNNNWPIVGGPAKITLDNSGWLIQTNGLFGKVGEMDTIICTIELTTAKTTTVN